MKSGRFLAMQVRRSEYTHPRARSIQTSEVLGSHDCKVAPHSITQANDGKVFFSPPIKYHFLPDARGTLSIVVSIFALPPEKSSQLGLLFQVSQGKSLSVRLNSVQFQPHRSARNPADRTRPILLGLVFSYRQQRPRQGESTKG